MLVSPAHYSHEPQWKLGVSGLSSASDQCLLCLVDILGDVACVSLVQRRVALRTLSSLLTSADCPWGWIRCHPELLCHIIDLTTDLYVAESCLELAVSVVSCVISESKEENILSFFMEKSFDIVHCKRQEESIYFCILVLCQFVETGAARSKYLLAHQEPLLSELLSAYDVLTEKSRKAFVLFLCHVMQVICCEGEDWASEVQVLALRVAEAEVLWLNDSRATRDMQLAYLKLVRQTVKSQDLLNVVLSAGDDLPGKPSLLLGLKKILTSKEESLMLQGVQCLHDIVQQAASVQMAQEVMDTDLTEFVFESLHTKNSILLSAAFQCLVSMAQHQAFYDKCHAVYGLDSCVSAVRQSISCENLGTAEKGLSLLGTLLERQPENMALFVSRSWQECCCLLESSLPHTHLTPLTLRCAAAFFRPHHQLMPVNLEKLGSFLSSVTGVVENVSAGRSESDSAERSAVIPAVMAIVVNAERLIRNEKKLYGTPLDVVQEFKNTLQCLSDKIIFPWISANWQCLKLDGVLESFLSIIASRMTDSSSPAFCRDLVTGGIPWKILSCLSQPQIAEPTRMAAAQALAQIVEMVARSLGLAWNTDPQLLVSGFAQVHWNFDSPEQLETSLCGSGGVVAVMLLLHLSYALNYRFLNTNNLLQVLRRVAVLFPDLTSQLAQGTVKSFVFLYTLMWNSLGEPDIIYLNSLDTWLHGQLERCTVQRWTLSDPHFFVWCFSTAKKSSTIGTQMVDNWLTETSMSLTSQDSDALKMSPELQEIVDTMRNNFHFLQSLVAVCSRDQTDSCAARMSCYLLLQWSQAISSERASEETVFLFEKVFTCVSRSLEDALSCSKVSTENSGVCLLPVLCGMLKSSLRSGNVWTFRPRTILTVSKLLVQSHQKTRDDSLQFLCQVCPQLDVHDSRALMAPIMQVEGFAQFLSDAFECGDGGVCRRALSVIVWLCEHGNSSEPTAHKVSNCVMIPVTTLMSRLAGLTVTSTTLDWLCLLYAALSGAVTELPHQGPVRFIRERSGFFLSGKVFSSEQFRQIFVYLQQCLTWANPEMRQKCVDCISLLLQTSSLIHEYVIRHPWNATVVRCALSARLCDGLTSAELGLCRLLLANGMEWNKACTDIFLNCLMKTVLSEELLSQVDWFLQELRSGHHAVSTELLTRVEEHLLSELNAL